MSHPYITIETNPKTGESKAWFDDDAAVRDGARKEELPRPRGGRFAVCRFMPEGDGFITAGPTDEEGVVGSYDEAAAWAEKETLAYFKITQ